jgi:hypothetical protein
MGAELRIDRCLCLKFFDADSKSKPVLPFAVPAKDGAAEPRSSRGVLSASLLALSDEFFYICCWAYLD